MGDLKRVKELLTHKDIDINYQDEDGWSSLMLAVSNRRKEIVKVLLTHKDIDINLKNKHECAALMVAVLNGHPETVKILLTHKDIDVNAIDDWNCMHVQSTLRSVSSHPPTWSPISHDDVAPRPEPSPVGPKAGC